VTEHYVPKAKTYKPHQHSLMLPAA